MTTIADFMTTAHRRCDEDLAAAETAVSGEDWANASAKWAECAAEMELHFAQEEKVLFPAFEEASGMTQGPTAVMRMEHEQMRNLLAQITEAVVARDDSRFLSLSETLMVLTQQHNMKEEQMLYPMCDRALDDADRIVSEFNALKSA